VRMLQMAVQSYFITKAVLSPWKKTRFMFNDSKHLLD
jgi:hypothetical protein